MEDYPFLGEAISRVLARLRESSGLSKRKLSQLSGIDRVYILQVEQGKYRPTVNFIFLIAKVFGITASTMLAMVESEIRNLESEESENTHEQATG